MSEAEQAEAAATTPPPAPASPPLPSRHTAATPGPRAARLQDLFSESLRHTLARVGIDQFSQCYPTVAAREPAKMRAVHRQMVDKLEERCNVRLFGNP